MAGRVASPHVVRAIHAAYAALDWDAAAREYFDDPRARFTARARREIRERGIAAVEEIAAFRRDVDAGPRRGATLLVGAGVAEIAVALAESLAGRPVTLLTTRAAEAPLLRVSLETGSRVATPRVVVGDALRARLPRPIAHLWLVSVLDDPDAFPALHDFFYQRADPRTFSGRRLDADRRRARAIVARLLPRLAPGALVTASDDAHPWIAEWAESRGLAVEAEPRVWRAPTTKDPVRFLRLAAPTPIRILTDGSPRPERP